MICSLGLTMNSICELGGVEIMGIDVSLIGTTETESEGSTKVWCGVSKVAVRKLSEEHIWSNASPLMTTYGSVRSSRVRR